MGKWGNLEWGMGERGNGLVRPLTFPSVTCSPILPMRPFAHSPILTFSDSPFPVSPSPVPHSLLSVNTFIIALPSENTLRAANK